MNELDRRILERAIGRRNLPAIVRIEVRSRDSDCWFVTLTLRSGENILVGAASEDEARALAARIDGWVCQPHTVPAPQPALSRRAAWALGWLVFLLVACGLAVHGFRAYALVDGWVVTRQALPSFVAAVMVAALLFVTVGKPGDRRPSTWVALALLSVVLTLVFAGAGKTLNAWLRTPRTLEVEGPIVWIDEESWDIRATQRTRIRAELVVLQVEDAAGGGRYTIEVPAWVAEREGVRLGAIWRDRFHRGAFGWLYREGTVWDERPFRPSVVPPR